jgi:hypothetical protein
MDFHNDGNFFELFIHQKIRKNPWKTGCIQIQKILSTFFEVFTDLLSAKSQINLIKKISAKVPFSFHLQFIMIIFH